MANLSNLNQSDIDFLREYLYFPDPAVVVQERIEHTIVPYQPGEIQLYVMDFNPPAEINPGPTPDDLSFEKIFYFDQPSELISVTPSTSVMEEIDLNQQGVIISVNEEVEQPPPVICQLVANQDQESNYRRTEFPSKNAEKKHCSKFTREGRYPCYICSAKFRKQGDLTKHINIVHLMVKKFKCSVCSQRFSYGHSLRNHENAHRQITCEYCGEVFSNSSKNKAHMEAVHEPKYQCETCGEKFLIEIRLQRHLKDNKDCCGVKIFYCDLCPKSYPYKSSLQRHIKEKHL